MNQIEFASRSVKPSTKTTERITNISLNPSFDFIRVPPYLSLSGQALKLSCKAEEAVKDLLNTPSHERFRLHAQSRKPGSLRTCKQPSSSQKRFSQSTHRTQFLMQRFCASFSMHMYICFTSRNKDKERTPFYSSDVK